MCIGPAGDSNHVPTGECAVRLARKGNFFPPHLWRARFKVTPGSSGPGSSPGQVIVYCFFAQDTLPLSAQECK